MARQTQFPPTAGKLIIRRMTRRASRVASWVASRVASRVASQQAISEEEALQRGMEEKSKEFVEAGAEVYARA